MKVKLVIFQNQNAEIFLEDADVTYLRVTVRILN